MNTVEVNNIVNWSLEAARLVGAEATFSAVVSSWPDSAVQEWARTVIAQAGFHHLNVVGIRADQGGLRKLGAGSGIDLLGAGRWFENVPVVVDANTFDRIELVFRPASP